MVSPVDSPASVLLGLALDAAQLRQQAIAQNIANVNTPGFRPLSVRFEEQMAAQRATLAQGGSVNLASLGGFQPSLIASADPNETVALDDQVAQLAGNTLHHQVLLRALNKHFALLGLAISEGKK